MKISTKARYGLRALIDLAVSSTGEQVPLVNIANRQELSVNYLEQVFSLLKKANIVRSVKGAQGGYILAKPAGKITVAEVICAIEGEIAVVEEEETNPSQSLLCINMQKCLKTHVWDKINEAIYNVINEVTLEDLMKDYEKAGELDSFMYYI